MYIRSTSCQPLLRLRQPGWAFLRKEALDDGAAACRSTAVPDGKGAVPRQAIHHRVTSGTGAYCVRRSSLPRAVSVRDRSDWFGGQQQLSPAWTLHKGENGQVECASASFAPGKEIRHGLNG